MTPPELGKLLTETDESSMECRLLARLYFQFGGIKGWGAVTGVKRLAAGGGGLG